MGIRYSFYKPLITVLLFTVFSQPLHAQTVVSGTVQDARTGQILPGAHVLLETTVGKTIRAGVTDSRGKFEFNNLAADSAVIKISYIGYHPLSRNVFPSGSTTELGILFLEPEEAEIDEVSVTGRVPMAVQVGDTTQYQAAAFRTTPDATAEDLVTKMPGIIVDRGKIQAQGEDVREVLVDGRPFFGQDPMATLRNLPAEIIDKVQVFDKLSEQAEFTGFNDGETSKTMNIITRVEMRNGTFGKGSTGYGTESTYLAGGNLNFFNQDQRISLVGQTNNVNRQNFSSEDLLGVMSSGVRVGRGLLQAGGGGRGMGRGGGMMGGAGALQGGPADVSDFLVDQQPGITNTHSFGINYSDALGKNLDLTASYFFNLSDNQSVSELYREYLSAEETSQWYLENEEANSRNINHRFNLKLDYRIDSANSITFRPRITFQQNAGSSFLTGENWLEGALLNMAANDYASDLKGGSYSGFLLYRHRFPKRGRTFSVNFNASYNDKYGTSDLISETEFYTGTPFTESLDQQSFLDNTGSSFSTNVVYTEPAGNTGMVQLNYRLGIRPGTNDRRTYDLDTLNGTYTLIDSLLSSTYKSNYLTHEAGTGYLFRKNNWVANFRLALESSTLLREEVFPSERNLEHSFLKLVGNAMLRYQFARQQTLNITYRTYTDPPSLDQLQEVVDNTNPLQLTTGNPSLDPSYQHQLVMRYSSIKPEKSRVFFLMLSGNLVQDYVANRTWIATSDTLLFGTIPLTAGTQLTRPENISGYRNVRSFINYGFPVGWLKSTLNLNMQLNYTRRPGYLNETFSFSNNSTATLGWVLSSNVSEKLDFTLSSRSNYSILRYSASPERNNNYFIQSTSLRMKWIIAGGFFVQSTLNHELYEGLSEELDNQSVLWNLGMGFKLFKNQRGELSLSVYDLLEENKNLVRRVSDIYTEDVSSLVLTRYLMLTFSYDLRSFKPGRQMPFRMNPMQEGFPGKNREQ